jgi:hypothetical protein
MRQSEKRPDRFSFVRAKVDAERSAPITADLRTDLVHEVSTNLLSAPMR